MNLSWLHFSLSVLELSVYFTYSLIFLVSVSDFFKFCIYIVFYILYIMSLLCGHKTQGPREKVLPTAAHLSQPQKQIQVRQCHTVTFLFNSFSFCLLALVL